MKKIIIYLIGLVCFIPMTAFGVSITLENPGALLFMVGGLSRILYGYRKSVAVLDE